MRPVVMGDIEINSLLYADDIILLSSTEKGLQINFAHHESLMQIKKSPKL
jgi:hypothetical protein